MDDVTDVIRTNVSTRCFIQNLFFRIIVSILLRGGDVCIDLLHYVDCFVDYFEDYFLYSRVDKRAS